jgi:acetyl-CoA carboxylase biotin carboxyl carrier protein
MTIKDVKELIALVSKANLAEFKYKDNDFELTIRGGEFHKSKAMPIMTAVQPITVSPAPDAVPAPVVVESPVAAAPAAPAPAPAVENPTGTIEIKSPMVGTFYRSAGPDKPAFTKVGDVVDENIRIPRNSITVKSVAIVSCQSINIGNDPALHHLHH